MFLSLFFAVSFVFAEEHFTGKMLIMGWGFDENDTRMQTNTAISAIIKYLEAAIYQMDYDENDEPSTVIELYERTDARYAGDRESVYIYLNTRSDEDYMDRCIEISFYILIDEQYGSKRYVLQKYTLIVSHKNYSWAEAVQEDKGSWRLIMKNDNAYEFFINYLERLRR
jgi:hypothetical protein